ncbi:MAG: HAD family hydrolase [Terriglobales bacterium]
MQTLVFDLDGVLVDVSRSFRACIGAATVALGGIAAGEQEIRALKLAGGFNNDWDVTRELLRRQGIAVDRERVIEVFSRIYRGAPRADPRQSMDQQYGPAGFIHRETWLLPEPLLRALGRRFALAIFTGRPRCDAEFTLRKFGVGDAFSALVALEDAPAKPAPDALLQLRASFYVGDTVDDAACAAAAQVPFIGIGQELAAYGAQFTAANVGAAAERLLAV